MLLTQVENIRHLWVFSPYDISIPDRKYKTRIKEKLANVRAEIWPKFVKGQSFAQCNLDVASTSPDSLKF